MERYELLKKNVDHLMNINGIKSYAELAHLAGMQQPTLHRIIKGKSKDPTVSSLESIGNALGVPFWSLIEIDLVEAGVTKIDTNRYFRYLNDQITNSELVESDLKLRKSIELAIQSIQILKKSNSITPEEIARCSVAIYRAATPDMSQDDLKMTAKFLAHASVS